MVDNSPANQLLEPVFWSLFERVLVKTPDAANVNDSKRECREVEFDRQTHLGAEVGEEAEEDDEGLENWEVAKGIRGCGWSTWFQFGAGKRLELLFFYHY